MTAIEDLPPSMTKRLPLEVPGITLARLAVAETARKQGYGGILLTDAMVRAKHVASQAGGFALFVDAKDEEGARFYAHYGFEPFPGDPLTLCILFASIPDFFWALLLPAAIIVSLSGFFEILEAIIAMLVNPELGAAYLGLQGDVWDAQKDMALAILGAALVMSLTRRRFYKRSRSSVTPSSSAQ